MVKVRLIRSIRSKGIAFTAADCLTTSAWRRSATTIWIAGRASAIAAATTRRPHATYRRNWSAMRISMPTAPGVPTRITATCGCPRAWALAGPRIATAIGRGSTPGGGVGWTMPLGAMPCRTTAAGPISEAPGHGYQARRASRRCMRRRWWLSSAAIAFRPRCLVPVRRPPPLAGFRSRRAKSTGPRTQ